MLYATFVGHFHNDALVTLMPVCHSLMLHTLKYYNSHVLEPLLHCYDQDKATKYEAFCS